MQQSQHREPLILPFFTRRRVGECINTGVALFKFYRKTMLRLALLVLLPIALLHAVPVFSLQQQGMDNQRMESRYIDPYSEYYDEDPFGDEEWKLVVMQSLAILAIMGLATAVAVRHHEDEPRGDEDVVRMRDLRVKDIFTTMGRQWFGILLSTAFASFIAWILLKLISVTWDNSLGAVFLLVFVLPIFLLLLYFVFVSHPHWCLKTEWKKGRAISLVFSNFGSFLGLVFMITLVVFFAQMVTELPWRLLVILRDDLLSEAARNVAVAWTYDVLLYLFSAFKLLYFYLSVLIAVLVCFYFYGNCVARKALNYDDLNLLIETFDKP